MNQEDRSEILKKVQEENSDGKINKKRIEKRLEKLEEPISVVLEEW